MADTPEAKRPVGRPLEYDSGIAALICKGIVEGKGLRKICEPDYMPDVMALYRWLGAKKEFRELYQLARDLQAELDIDEVIEIAENSQGDIEEIEFESKFGPGSKPVYMRAKLDRDKLRIETRLKRMALLSPHKFGARVQQHQTPNNPGQEMEGLELTQERKLEAVKKIWAMAEAAKVEDGNPA